MFREIEQASKKSEVGLGKTRSYNEVVEHLDLLATAEYAPASLLRMKELDRCLGNVSSKIDVVVIGGTNGKSSTAHFAAKLLQEEGFKVGSSISSHILSYNERINLSCESLSNKTFTDVVNEVVNVADMNNIKATTHEILIMSSLAHFVAEKADIALIEANYGGKYDAVAYLNPKIAVVTRIADDDRGLLGDDLDAVAFEMMEIAKPGCWFISSEQSKLRLQKMKDWCDTRSIKWVMPIRKLASLPYIYEQLYGRIASLGERIAQIYVEDIKGKFSPFLRGNLLVTQKGQRGRPTLEAKRQAELNPVKTLKSFWNDQFNLMRCRFEFLDKEKPSILLDNATNVDAFTNLFLGVRLLHYQKPIKGLALVLSVSKVVSQPEMLKLIRYLLRKVSGQVFFVAASDRIAAHNAEELALQAKAMGIKAKACLTVTEAFEQAKAVVDERDGVVVFSGSHELIREYWKQRGIKKF